MEDISFTLDTFVNYDNDSSEVYSCDIYIHDMLDKQKGIIRALFYIPAILTKYIHYRGSEMIEFKELNVPIPHVPLIPYNDGGICCILDKVIGSETQDGICDNLTVQALGPKGKIGIPYRLRDNCGNDLIAKLSKIDNLDSKYHSVPPTSLVYIDSKERSHCITDVKISRIRYIASDEFTNETLIAYVLNYIADEASLPYLFVRHYQGAVCSNPKTGKKFGLNIMENCDLGSLDKITLNPNFQQYLKSYDITNVGSEIKYELVESDTILQILTQITVGLHMLQNYAGFVSGDLKSGNIFVKSEPIDTEYQGIKLKAPFTCKIADYGKSSCMLPRTNGISLRFYNENTLANIYLKIHPFEPDITESDGEYYYSIGNLRVSQIYTRTRHMGIPFYRSFDFYTVLVSILMHPAFYYMFFSNENLRSIFWNPIWFNDEENIEIFKRIQQLVHEKKGNKLRDAINVLRGIRLKCDAINLVMLKIKGTTI